MNVQVKNKLRREGYGTSLLRGNREMNRRILNDDLEMTRRRSISLALMDLYNDIRMNRILI